jgi:hypothetical protein
MPSSVSRKPRAILPVFLISALRAILEMLALCLLGQAVLYVLAGQGRSENLIYRLFDLITRSPRQLVAILLPRSCSASVVGILTFVIVLVLWLGLAIVRKFI